MTEIVCDSCRKVIPSATRNYSWESRDDRYDTIKDKDLCPECLATLDGAILKEMESEAQFSFPGFQKTLEEKLGELTES